MCTADSVRDVLELVTDRARDATMESRDAAASDDEVDKAYWRGRAIAYYDVVSSLLAQAHVFGLEAEGVRLPEINPDRELLPP
jgi:hypothetical protein